MTRLNLVLLLALLVSSVYLVRVSYESRRLFAALDRAQGEERSLDHESERKDGAGYQGPNRPACGLYDRKQVGGLRTLRNAEQRADYRVLRSL